MILFAVVVIPITYMVTRAWFVPDSFNADWKTSFFTGIFVFLPYLGFCMILQPLFQGYFEFVPLWLEAACRNFVVPLVVSMIALAFLTVLKSWKGDASAFYLSFWTLVSWQQLIVGIQSIDLPLILWGPLASACAFVIFSRIGFLIGQLKGRMLLTLVMYAGVSAILAFPSIFWYFNQWIGTAFSMLASLFLAIYMLIKKSPVTFRLLQKTKILQFKFQGWEVSF